MDLKQKLKNCRKLSTQNKFSESPKNQDIYILSGNLSTIPKKTEIQDGFCFFAEQDYL